MSARTATGKIEAAKMLPPREMMVTRRKNAQSQRQLRNKDRSMTRITQLLMRSPPKTSKINKPKTPPSNTFKMPAPKARVASKSPKKVAVKKTSLPKSAIKKTETIAISTEYYPNKKKRLLKTNKIVLKPKHELKVVDGLNKRKRTTPQSSKPQIITTRSQQPILTLIPPVQRVQTPEPSFTELVRLEELEVLGDEDFMEILTCPSPVWWEDPPGAEYDEDPIWPNPILSRKEENKQKQDVKTMKPQKKLNKLFLELINRADRKVKEIEVSKTSSDKFANKRFGLENILCNIKSRTEKKTNEDKSKPKDQVRRSHKRKRVSENSSADEDIFADIRDDILKDLENLDIPMENPNGNKATSTAERVDSRVKSSPVMEKSSTSKMDISPADTGNVDKSEVEDKLEITLEEGKTQLFFPEIKRKRCKVIKNSESMSPKTLIWTSNNGDKKIINLINDPKVKSKVEQAKVERNTGNINVPKQMPPLQKFSKVTDTKTAESPTHSKFEHSEMEDTNESSSNVSCDYDTVSDTNVEFANEDVVSDADTYSELTLTKSVTNDETSDQKVKETDKGTKSFLGKGKVNVKRRMNNINDASKYIIDNKQDCIVVYKIIDNSEDDAERSKDEIENRTDESKNIDDAKTKDSNTEKDVIHQNGNINDFFKKCKGVNRKMSGRKTSKLNKDGGQPDMTVKENAKKPICVSESKTMNYCLKCSSIFDTSNCIYCCRKKSDENHNLSVRLKKVKKLDA